MFIFSCTKIKLPACKYPTKLSLSIFFLISWSLLMTFYDKVESSVVHCICCFYLVYSKLKVVRHAYMYVGFVRHVVQTCIKYQYVFSCVLQIQC